MVSKILLNNARILKTPDCSEYAVKNILLIHFPEILP